MFDMLINDLEAQFPFIRWREPVPVVWGSSQKFACRVCMAAEGLTVHSTHQWPTTAEAVDHIHHHLPKNGIT